jgi:hypothetical protein
MPKFVLVYTGGSGMGDSPEDQQKLMEEWGGWFGTLGDAVVDPGSPFGPSRTLAPDGAVRQGGSAGLTGYSVIEAGDLAGAADKAKGCPVLAGGGDVQIYESIPIG